jgi:hypothetical protein
MIGHGSSPMDFLRAGRFPALMPSNERDNGYTEFAIIP